MFHLIDPPPENSQYFVEIAHYPDATPLKISIRTHSIPAWSEDIYLFVDKVCEGVKNVKNVFYEWPSYVILGRYITYLS